MYTPDYKRYGDSVAEEKMVVHVEGCGESQRPLGPGRVLLYMHWRDADTIHPYIWLIQLGAGRFVSVTRYQDALVYIELRESSYKLSPACYNVHELPGSSEAPCWTCNVLT